MASTTQHVDAGPRGVSSSFIWTRLGSFLSIVPLGIWTVVHLSNNLAVFRGAEAWEESVTQYSNPIGMAIAFLIALLPLVLHTIWGVQRLFTFRPNNVRYGYFENLKYILQRVTAAGIFLFIGAHMWLALIRPRLFTGRGEVFSDISREMHFHGPTLLVYLLGTLGVAYHLGNGIQSFAWTWGLDAGRQSFRRANVIAILAFLLLTIMSWAIIYKMYEMGAQFGPLDND